MPSDHPADWGVVAASEALHARRLSAADLTEACLQRIAERDAQYGAWIRVYDDDARAAARSADTALASGSAGPLTGVPIGLKDVIGVAGRPLTADSAVLEGNVAPADAIAWRRLRDAGMVLLGHLHCGEFANGVWGANPWGPTRFSPGGSSSGSGIALAARTVPATVGSDGRGSIRMPAAFGNVTAVKPSFGLVSTAGCIPITFSYDVLGPMARSAADCALLLRAMGEEDVAYPREPRAGDRPLTGSRIGIPRFDGEPMSDGVAAVYAAFQAELASLGAELVTFGWPANPLESDGTSGDWVHVLGAEARAIHEQFADRADLYRDEFRTLFAMLSGSGSAVDYVRAQVRRAEYADTWTAIFADLGLTAVAHPAAQDEAFGIDVTSIATAPPRLMFGAWNDVNFPVVSVPAGLSPTDGSPVGIQLVGRPFAEATLLQVAIDVQARTDHHERVPDSLGQHPPYQGPPRRERGPQPPFVPPANPFEGVVRPASGRGASRSGSARG